MNKFEYLWVVQGFYCGWEDLTASTLRREATDDIRSYRKNDLGSFRIIQRRILNRTGAGK